MSFVFKAVENITKTIEFTDPETGLKADFALKFRILGMKERTEVLKRIAAKELSLNDALLENIVGMEGIAGVDGKTIEFSKDFLKSLLDKPYIFEEVTQVYEQLHFKGVKERLEALQKAGKLSQVVEEATEQ